MNFASFYEQHFGLTSKKQCRRKLAVKLAYRRLYLQQRARVQAAKPYWREGLPPPPRYTTN